MSNRIGIKVDVHFPSASELRNKLQTAWDSVNKELEAKVKLGVDESSFKQLKKDIKKALGQDVYEIKIDTKDAMASLDKLTTQIKSIDKILKAERTLKVNLDVVNLKSTLGDLLGSMGKAQKETRNAMAEGMKGFNEELKLADKNLSKMSKKYKLDRNGQTQSVTTTGSKKDKVGYEERVRVKESADGNRSTDVEYLYNKETALKNVKAEMQKLYELEKKMHKEGLDGNKESYDRYKKEHDYSSKNVDSIKADYKERYGEQVDSSEMIQALKKKYELELDILRINKEKELQLKKEKEEQERINKEMAEYEKKISKAFGEYLSNTKEILGVQQKLEGATGKHKEELQAQLQHHKGLRDALEKEHDLTNVISAEQRKELKALEDKLNIQNKVKLAQKEEEALMKAMTQRVGEYEQILNRAFGSYKESLKESSRLHKEIEKATGLHKEELQEQLKTQELKRKKLEQEHNLMGDITNAQKEELESLKQTLKQSEKLQEAKEFEKELQAEINKELKEQKALVDKLFREYLENTKQMDKAYDEMRKATGKHKEALMASYNVMIKKRESLEQEHDLLNKITGEQKRELKNLHSQLYYADKIKSAKAKEEEKSRELKEATSKIVQLEQKRFEVKKKLVSASEGEKEVLLDELHHYKKIIDKIKQGVEYSENATHEQKQQLKNLAEINDIHLRLLRTKKEEQSYTEREKIALARTKAVRQEILSIEQKIASLKPLKDKDGNTAKIQSLEHSLRLMRQEEQQLLQQYDSEIKIKQAIEQQNALLGRTHGLKMQQIAHDNKIIASQEKGNKLLKDYQDSLRKVGQLQRDLVFAGDREEVIIMRAIRAEQQKLATMREEISASRMISNERKEEIRQIEKAQAEQLKLNKLRQDAREVDRVYDNAYGVTDFRSVAMEFTQGFRAVLDGMVEVDEAFMRVKKVANATEENIQSFKDTSYDIASSLGVSAPDYMMAVEKWITAGYSLEKSEELGQISTIGSFVGNIDTDLMAKWLSVPLNAYDSEQISANDIINVMNETSNNYAVEMEELGKAYMRGAGASKNAGVTFEELTGMITGAQEATRMGGERIGTSMKTISGNYNKLKAPETAMEITKAEKFQEVGIDISKTNSLTELLEQVSGVWDDLDGVKRNRLILALAGQEHSNVLTGILNEWDTVQKASNGAIGQLGLEERGSAYQEFAEQKDSVRFQLAELQNAWLELMNTIGESDGLVKNVLEFLTESLNKLSDLARNDKLMEVLKLLAIGIGFHAGTNGMLRVFDILGTGLRNTSNDLKGFFGLFTKGEKAVNRSLSSTGRDSTVVGSVGGNGNGGNNNRNGSNDSTVVRGGLNGGSNGGARETRAERRRREREERRNGGSNTNGGADADELARQANDNERKASSVSSSVGKVAKTAFKMLPIVGDALLIAELTGVDVFGGVGKLYKKVVGESENFIKESEEAIRNLELKNNVSNGTVQQTQTQFIGKENSSWQDSVTKAKENGGDLSPEDYAKLKEEYTNTVKELGLEKYAGEVPLEITWNESDKILDDLNRLDQALEKYRYQESLELGKGYMKELNKLGKGEDKASKSIETDEKEIENLKAENIKLQEKANESLEKGDVMSSSASQNLITKNKAEIEKLEESVKKSEEIKENVAKAYEGLGETLLTLNTEDFDAILEGANEEEKVRIIDAMNLAYQEATATLKAYKGAQALTNKETALTKDEFGKLISVVGETDEVLGNTSFTDYINNTNGAKDAVDAHVDSLTTSQEEAVNTASVINTKGQEIKTAMEEAAGGPEELEKKIKDAKKEAEGMKDKTITITTIYKSVRKAINGKMEEWFGDGSNSVSTALVEPTEEQPNLSGSTKGLVSANVSTNGSGLTSNATSTKKATTTAKKATTTATPDNSKVDESVWRYWKTEDKQTALESAMTVLTKAIEENSKNYSKLDSLYSNQITNLNNQKVTQTTLRNAKATEARSVLSQLSKYGFKYNSNTLEISNLERAKSLTGENATKANELLNTWHSIVGELGTLKQEIANIDTEIKNIKITKELNVFQTALDRIDKLMTTSDKRNSLNGIFLSLIDENDFDLKSMAMTKLMQTHESYAKSLINEFNSLSIKTVAYAENGEVLLGTLESLKDKIMENSEAVYEYIQAVNDNEMGRASKDVNEFSEALNRLQSNLTNTRDSVKEGLLSGTGFNDLQSAKNSTLDLANNNKLDKYAQDILDMENKLQTALDQYAVKNVDRTAKVANANLQINKEMYNTLLNFAGTFNNGKAISGFDAILKTLDTKATEDMAYRLDSELTALYGSLYEKQVKLNDKYASKLSSSNYETRIQAEYDYAMESMALEKEINEYKIKASKKTVEEYNRQLKDGTLTQAQIKDLKSLIKAEEDSIVDLQLAIKGNVADLYEVQLSQIDNIISKYDDYVTKLEYSLSLMSAIKPYDLKAQLSIMSEINQVQKDKKNQLKESVATTRYEMSLLQQGSYEWNILNSKVSEYNEQLQDSASSIVDMNNQIRDMKITDVLDKFEKTLFGGKTSTQFQEFKDLWLQGLEKELALEEMYQKINEIGTSNFDAKMALLDKQERVSRLEADYLNKQLDIFKLQQELENSREQRTVKTLQQNEDGTFQWNYVADVNENEIANQIKQAQIELQEMESQAKASYIDSLRNVAVKIQNGEYSNSKALDSDLLNLQDAYSLVLGSLPNELKGMSDGLRGAYKDGDLANNSVLNEMITNTPVQKTIDRLKDSMVLELNKLGDRVEKAVASSLKSANVASVLKSNNVSTKDSTATSINIEKLEFPNATSSDEIRNALVNLPQYAMQYANSKK